MRKATLKMIKAPKGGLPDARVIVDHSESDEGEHAAILRISAFDDIGIPSVVCNVTLSIETAMEIRAALDKVITTAAGKKV